MVSKNKLRDALAFLHIIQKRLQNTWLSTTIHSIPGENKTHSIELIIYENSEKIASCSLSNLDENMEKYQTELAELLAILIQKGIKLQ